jgi:two-component system torCAD operon response regulator TorR
MNGAAILLVGDDPEVRHVSSGFGRAGYVVTAVRDDGEALAEVTRACPDLVVMAESAWESTGVQLVGYLWGICSTPLIILGESCDSADGIPYLEMGADMYVTLPVDVRELVVRARNLVRITKRELENAN